MKKANWDCILCRGFGVIGDGSRGEARQCPACFTVDPEPEPNAAANPGPYSVWHIHGEADDPGQALSRGNFDNLDEASDHAFEQADEFANGKIVMYDRTGTPRLTLPCPLHRPGRLVEDEAHVRYAA